MFIHKNIQQNILEKEKQPFHQPKNKSRTEMPPISKRKSTATLTSTSNLVYSSIALSRQSMQSTHVICTYNRCVYVVAVISMIFCNHKLYHKLYIHFNSLRYVYIYI